MPCRYALTIDSHPFQITFRLNQLVLHSESRLSSLFVLEVRRKLKIGRAMRFSSPFSRGAFRCKAAFYRIVQMNNANKGNRTE